MQTTRLLATTLAASLALCTSAAHAGGPSERWEFQNAAGTCQGALPAFAGTLRARPLAIGNEGAATAFVTCSLEGGANQSSRATTRVTIVLGNINESSVPVSCTLVDGYMEGSAVVATYYPASTSVGKMGGQITWVGGEEELPQFIDNANISCQLPPGITINYVGQFFTPVY